jgi:hypothetical protein
MRIKSDIKTKQNQILRDEIKKKINSKKWFKTNRNEKNNDQNWYKNKIKQNTTR